MRMRQGLGGTKPPLRRPHGIVGFLLGVSLALCGASPILAQGPSTAVAPTDPNVIVGALPNGMRYAVSQSAKPSHGLSIRFDFDSGSLQETEVQRGGAHFLEHMAFEGGRRLSAEAVSGGFQKAGVSMDRDRNAFTTLEHTFYVLDLSDISREKLDIAFTWLRDVADGLDLTPEGVERQRGVVTTEISVRRDAGTAVGESLSSFLTPQLTAPNRSPAGTPASLKAMNSATLRDYYQTWYRPERAFIVVVGDAPPAEIVHRIEATFADWRAATPPPVEVDPGKVDLARKTEYYQVHAPNFSQGGVNICRMSPPDPQLPPSEALTLRQAEQIGWMSPLQIRLEALARKPDSPLISTRLLRRDLQKRAIETCVLVTPKPDLWRQALATVSDELRRLAAYGVSADELEDAMSSTQAALESQAGRSRSSEEIAADLLESLRRKDPPVSPTTRLQLFKAVRSRVTLSGVKAAFDRDWGNASEPLVAVVSNGADAVRNLDKVWAGVLARPVPEALAASSADWPYGVGAQAAKVVARERFLDPAFLRVTFDNGVIANIKRLPSEAGRVDLRLRFGGGQLQYAPKDVIPAVFSTGVFLDGGLGKSDFASVERILRRHALGVGLSLERDHFAFAGSAQAKDLALLGSVMCAYLDDPGFRDEIETHLSDHVRTYYTESDLNPIISAQKAMKAELPSLDVAPLPEEAVVLGLRPADIKAYLAPTLHDAPVEVTVVGDLSEDDAIDALAHTLGRIRPRNASFPLTSPEAARLRFPPSASAPSTGHHLGLADRAAVVAIWPTFAWDALRQREVRAITLLREVLGDRIRRQVREKLGLTYTPSIVFNTERGGDQGHLQVAIETSPTTAKAVADVLVNIGQELAQEGVESEELERMRKPILDDSANQRERAGWWLNTLDGSARDPYRLAQARTWWNDYATIPASEVSAAAKAWLARPPILAFGLPREGAPVIVTP